MTKTKEQLFGLDRFTVTDDHVKLARRMYCSWDGCEFGAPAVDCKRPYGNGDVLNDMREILGRPVLEGYTEGTDDEELTALHRSTEKVLEITLRTGRLEAGEYVTPKYHADWRKA